jgi:signal transduction histidine kinase
MSDVPVGWRNSLEGRLILRLAVLLVAAMAVGFAAMVAASYHTAEELSNEALADRFVAEFLSDAAWVFPLFAVCVLALAAWTIRTSLRPVLAVSERATAIAPGATDVRLPPEGLPSELLPLVAAVNHALDRLEGGFTAQRQFTADAAHELRTPLAILTAALDNLEGAPEVERLRLDAARMNRIVGQLLRVARLDAQPLAGREPVDLNLVAAGVVEHMAPWAAAARRRLGLEPADAPVRVLGDADALSDALRNLIENAVAHAPVDTEIVVGVGADGSVSVADAGPGVPVEDRERVFARFWRGRSRSTPGAGLGLAIVSEVARAHGGQVTVGDADGGGALFRISLPTTPAC